MCCIYRGVRYHEPEHWKFGEPGNKYFRHATGQIYAVSRDLAVYISKNMSVLQSLKSYEETKQYRKVNITSYGTAPLVMPLCQRLACEIAPLADRTHTAHGPCSEKLVIFSDTSCNIDSITY